MASENRHIGFGKTTTSDPNNTTNYNAKHNSNNVSQSRQDGNSYRGLVAHPLPEGEEEIRLSRKSMPPSETARSGPKSGAWTPELAKTYANISASAKDPANMFEQIRTRKTPNRNMLVKQLQHNYLSENLVPAVPPPVTRPGGPPPPPMRYKTATKYPSPSFGVSKANPLFTGSLPETLTAMASHLPPHLRGSRTYETPSFASLTPNPLFAGSRSQQYAVPPHLRGVGGSSRRFRTRKNKRKTRSRH